MNRPMYESSRDRANEQRAIEAYCRSHSERVHAVKLPIVYAVDWGIFHDDNLICWAECKRRFNERARYETILLSCRKYLAGMDLCRISGKPFLLVVQWNDFLGTHVCDGKAAKDIRVGGRRDRGDWQDVEPVVHIPVSSFFEVPKNE